MRKNTIAMIEIILLVSMSFAISYSLRQENTFSNYNYSYKKVAFNIINYIFGKGIVSALDSSDFKNGVSTCLLSKNNEICQEFPSSECNSKCTTSCIPTTKSQVSACSIGTCFDPLEGTCQPGSPKQSCEQAKGQWFNDPYGNIAQCKQGCCVLGDQASFTTSQACSRKSSLLGLENNFRPEISTEIQCLALAKTQEEGACVYDQDFEKTCTFTTKASCLQKTGRSDSFFPGILCSNPNLNTTCKKQARTACVEGQDEIYWFDSCGNKENIYDANKAKSWNDGKVLSKNESCSLQSGNNLLGYQSTCGNCNYFLGSVCGAKTTKAKLSDSSQQFVCKDLSCTDAQGKKRKNGESWCAYQGSIGVDEKNNRATDTPGSRHFREVCIDGNVQTEACGDARSEICIESQTQTDFGKFSSAACRINLWQQCAEYNTEVTGDGAARISSEKQRDDKCSQNPDCFVKKIEISDNFKFNICAPKYPPGFDLRSNSDSAEGICSFASQTCTAVYVKKAFGGWKCEANCECEKSVFTEKMNDLCISLGDCGGKVNYNGQFTKNYQSYGSEKASDVYNEGLNKYSTPVKGKFANAGAANQFYSSLGIPSALGTPGKITDDSAGAVSAALLTSGAIGVTLVAASYGGYAAGAGAIQAFGSAGGFVASKIPVIGGLFKGSVASANPAAAAYGGAFAGAAIGLAVTSLLIKFTGIGPGLDKGITYALLGAGTFSGAIIGANLAGGSSGLGGLVGTLAPWAWFAGIAVIVSIVIFAILGVGKTKKVTVQFTCQPWEAPLGGAKCKQCGKDGFPCSPYSCHALGQACEFINEGTGQEACIDSNPNDVSAPSISPDKKVLQTGYSYEDENDNGVRLKGPENCVQAYAQVSLGIALKEPGQCRFDTAHTSSFDDMQFDFGGNLFVKSHSMVFRMPSLESLGLSGYDPSRKADYNLYVRCQDSRGNKNEKEYAINFCIKPGEDITSPIIERTDNNQYLKFNATSKVTTIYTNEPSECRWDIRDKDYNEMSKNFNCDNDLASQTFSGWKCTTSIPITKDDSTFYVRCKDQPWLNESAKRNSNHESYPLVFKKSSSPLVISSISPDNTSIIVGTEPASVEVKAITSGGADGTARCSYKVDNYYVDFSSTLGTEHRNIFNQFSSGEKVLPVRCEDIAGNVAERTSRFSINIDTQAPEVTRVYGKDNSLIVITNEPATCSFVNYINRTGDACSFEFNDGRLLSGSDILHSTSLESLPYYIKCKDKFDNSLGGCNIVVQKGLFS
ncbi:hypothetical protein KW787_03040 [Candidatus Pacearchaeota archaeon]|nr:hypothetical protein [Candidatus Pacearchaeota archaeon]